MANHSQVKDTGAFFTIAPEARQVQVPSTHKVIGVVGDHLAEQLTFEVPQRIDGHDITGCARRYITWLNSENEAGTDLLEELAERPAGAKDGMIYLAWTIRDLTAVAKGVVQFSVHFEDIDEDGETLLYHWGTSVCKSCEILDGINHAVGLYTSMRVSGSTLIIDDPTPLHDKDAPHLGGDVVRPEGTLNISKPGVHDVTAYAQVNVRTTSGVLTVTENGVYPADRYESVKVNAPKPSGTRMTFENGTFDVTEYAKFIADVDERIPPVTKLTVVNIDNLSRLTYYEARPDTEFGMARVSYDMPYRETKTFEVVRGTRITAGLAGYVEVDTVEGGHIVEDIDEAMGVTRQKVLLTDVEAVITLKKWGS